MSEVVSQANGAGAEQENVEAEEGFEANLVKMDEPAAAAFFGKVACEGEDGSSDATVPAGVWTPGTIESLE